ncbi:MULTISPECIES: AMP-binding protein [Salinivibrio]|uniref:AMP-dependent synthetase n=1 Tax=Salinivibrio kushneri TaxID=1908198 RepID=A0AB36K971_9GAMM|nr:MULTISPECIES: AMP-binding protein [Salinivibrio]ODP97341.1 AMP-dependent synthetase [Salinivibrio sp. BNH]OOE45406.1 AMP-dependent synthetase [Salinivibrio kushneri]OOE49084.1 AMP-dependent synthetase [Salinivibrio kushneri]OOE50467.1 AMP-dependent synthetase [Salinivibrio kushneri]OOE62959.1 AMP-dependent synthetase [Salinivibrio kushneri]
MSHIKPNDQILRWADERPSHVFLRQIHGRRFHDYTFADVADQALRMVTALRDMGLKPGDKVALISKNCAEWFIADLAMMMGSYISVPIFPTAGTDTIDHVVTHSESKAMFVGKLDDSKALSASLENMPGLKTIAFPYPTISCHYEWHDLIANHEASDERPVHQDSDVMSLVYTSGTSGLPKGAILSYGGYCWSAQRLIDHIGIEPDDRLFSYLPLAHITERVYIMGSAIMGGIPTAFPESLDTFIEDVKMHRPTLFISVPRLWTLFQQRIQEKLPDGKLNLLLRIPLVNNLIKSKIAKNLGLDQARVLGCGSAPVAPALLQWYEKLGLHITEAWGMTESYAYSTLNYPFRADKIGTVGNAGPGVEIKIADDQEILVKSEGLFSGYYKNEEASAETLVDGWLHTGDLGELDSEGYLSISGRKNDTFKTAKGKFVAPVPIEKRLFELSNAEMLCVIGSGMPAPILLALPHHFPNFDRARYERRVKKVIDTINGELESHQQIKGVLMIKEPWSIENGKLTPTLKIRRHKLEQEYHDVGTHWPKGTLVQWEEDLR